MKINGIKREEVSVEITNEQADTLMFSRLYELTNWNENWFIEDGLVKHEVEYYTSGYRTSNISIIRLATEDDIETYDTILYLHSLIKREQTDNFKKLGLK